MSNIAIYPGVFDPITHGHMDIIHRAARLFPGLIVAVAESTQKQPLLSLARRLELAQTLTARIDQVEVVSFMGLTVDLAAEHKANVLVRSVRNSIDLEYEFSLSCMNKTMLPDLETIFLAPSEDLRFISATVIREIVSMGGDVSGFVDPIVAKALRKII